MILKIKEKIDNKNLFINQIYPIFAYKTNSNNIREYKVYDECRSFTWISEGFDIINSLDSDYVEQFIDDEKIYLYKYIEPSFFTKFYLEEDNFEQTISCLEENMIKIFLNDLTIAELSNVIIDSIKESEYVELLLKAFFLKANEFDINEFANNLTNKLENFSDEDIQFIVEKMSSIKSSGIRDLFERISINSNYSESIMNIVLSYLYY